MLLNVVTPFTVVSRQLLCIMQSMCVLGRSSMPSCLLFGPNRIVNLITTYTSSRRT